MTVARIKEEVFVTCMSCGKTSETFVLVNQDGGLRLPAKARCPKCSNTAITNSFQGLWVFMREAAAQIAQLKLDMIDLQDDGEER